MKKLARKLIVAVAAMAMVFAVSVPAFAADGDQLATPESTITVTGLETGDAATAYQIVKWENNAWVLNGTYGSLTVDNITDGIDATEAATIANAIGTQSGTAMTVSSGTATESNVTAGVYYVKVTPGTSNDYIYNPIFVSADYIEGGNTIAATETYRNSSIAKKQNVTVTKTAADTSKDVAVGDTIAFTVQTTIPTYTNAYSQKSFVITDTLSTGLTLTDAQQNAISVTSSAGDLTSVTDYTITATASGYTITFTDSYLSGLTSNPTITVSYSATVNSQATYDVNEMTNEAKVQYTHTPDGETNEVTDKTYHYTFSIGASVLGNDSSKTKELVKTEETLDDDGNATNTSWAYTQQPSSVKTLSGAVFALYSDENCTKQVGENFTTGTDGVISFSGLDATTYYLKEVSAPSGYVTSTTVVPVVINANYNDDGTLKDYSVNVGTNASTYTFSNEGTTETVTIGENSVTTAFTNKPGAELPSTGGMGTTIFYVLGAILVIGAGVVLVTRRRVTR